MSNFLEVKKDIYWVGALDFDIRTFDIVMYTEYGTTYNSYIVKGAEKTVLIEAVKERFSDEHEDRINGLCEITDIDYVVVNHTEPDHSSAIKNIIQKNPKVTVLGSCNAIKYLKEIVNIPFKYQEVKEDLTIDLGGKTLNFINAPFLHWPDSMYTYIPEDKVLFTCDSFGCHYCDEKVFNDKIEGDFLDSYKYYFDCIMGPFKNFVINALDKIADLDIDIICPGHGPVLRKDLDKYINLYREWSQKEENDDVVICYVSAYGYTKKLAEEVAKGIANKGLNPKLYDVETADINEVMENLSVAKGLIIGSPTIVNDTVLPIWQVLIRLNEFIHKGLYAGVFGSYGWSGKAIDNIAGRFQQLNLKMPVESLKINFNPSEEQCKEAINFGERFVTGIAECN